MALTKVTYSMIQGAVFNVLDYGATGDGSTDDWAAIQAAIDAAQPTKGAVYLPAPSSKYAISKPLVLDDGQQLIGESRESCIIEKTTTATPSPALGTVTVTRAGTPVTYNYDKNAIVVIKKPTARAYPNGIGIHNITLQGKSGVTVEYGIYAPRLSRSHFSDVYINLVTNGVFTYDTFTCLFERIDVWNTSYGFNWANDGSGVGSGTSCTFTACGVNVADVYGWYFYGLVYSSVVGSFAESIVSAVAGNRPAAYFFQLCKGLTVSGCGVETVKGYVFRISSSTVSINGGNYIGLTGDTFGGNTATIYLDSGAKVAISAARFAATTSPGNIYNEYVTGADSFLTYDGTTIRPSGGTAAVSTSGGVISDVTPYTTFTPTVVGSTSAGTATYATQAGYYTRVGNIVYYMFTLSWSAGTGTGNLYIGGLPVASKSGTTSYAQGSVQPGSTLTVSANTFVSVEAIPGTTTLRIIEVPVGTGTVVESAYDSAASLGCTGFYFV